MGRVNWGRVVLGGLVSLVVYSALGAASAFLYLMKEGRNAFEHIGLRVVSHMSDPGFFAFVAVLAFVSGILSIWLYAAIRPRYGPGIRTAVIAGVVIWILAQLLPLLYWSQLLGLGTRLVILNGVTTLVVVVTATLAGTWFYQE